LYLQKLAADPTHDLAALLTALIADPEFVRICAQLGAYRSLQYRVDFENFYHPLVCALRKTLYTDGVGALMDRDTQLQQTAFRFDTNYDPTAIVNRPFPIEDIDFREGGAYAGYNWELFFHLPLAIAVQLSKDQQFEAAMTWFHYI